MRTGESDYLTRTYGSRLRPSAIQLRRRENGALDVMSTGVVKDNDLLLVHKHP
jgi:hypothetical protein